MPDGWVDGYSHGAVAALWCSMICADEWFIDLAIEEATEEAKSFHVGQLVRTAPVGGAPYRYGKVVAIDRDCSDPIVVNFGAVTKNCYPSDLERGLRAPLPEPDGWHWLDVRGREIKEAKQ